MLQNSLVLTIRKSLSFFRNKDKVPDSLHTNIVYKFTCDQCTNCSCVGETVRHLDTRIKECFSGNPEPTEIHTHVAEKSNFKVVRSSRFTKITEALVLATEKKTCLLNDMMKSYKLKLFSFLVSCVFSFFIFILVYVRIDCVIFSSACVLFLFKLFVCADFCSIIHFPDVYMLNVWNYLVSRQWYNK